VWTAACLVSAPARHQTGSPSFSPKTGPDRRENVLPVIGTQYLTDTDERLKAMASGAGRTRAAEAVGKLPQGP